MLYIWLVVFFVFVSGKEVLMTLKMSYCDVLDIGTESVKMEFYFLKPIGGKLYMVWLYLES